MGVESMVANHQLNVGTLAALKAPEAINNTALWNSPDTYVFISDTDRDTLRSWEKEDFLIRSLKVFDKL